MGLGHLEIARTTDTQAEGLDIHSQTKATELLMIPSMLLQTSILLTGRLPI